MMDDYLTKRGLLYDLSKTLGYDKGFSRQVIFIVVEEFYCIPDLVGINIWAEIIPILSTFQRHLESLSNNDDG